MSRQFRSDDTSKWTDGFGTGKDGDLNYTGGNFGGVSGHGFAIFSGTSGQYTGTFTDQAYFNGSNAGRVGDIVLIHQTQGSNAGNWELNKIIGRSGSTLTFKYPLQFNYVSDSSNKAQIVSSGQFLNVSLSGTTTPYLGWNGNSGGIFFLVVKGTLSITGTLYAGGTSGSYTQSCPGTVAGGTGYGFKGGTASQISNGGAGQQGDSPTGVGSYLTGGNNTLKPANGMGGGNGAKGDSTENGGAGGGGGYATSGGNGQWDGGGPGGNGGAGGGTGGSADLTTAHLGAGGGGAGLGNKNSYIGSGGAGGGFIFIIAKNITISGNINVNGGNGGAKVGEGAGGGGGSGGSCLIKAQTATLGTTKITATGGTKGDGAWDGGAGGNGRIHLDYKISYSGTTNPTLDVRQDLTLNDMYTASFLLNFV